MDRWQQTDQIDDIIRDHMTRKVPESKVVNKKIQNAYEEIRARQAKETVFPPADRSLSKRPGKTGGAAKYAATAALFMTVILFFVKNPALAAQLPLIGHIFKDLEQEVSYPGNYSENSITIPAMPQETGAQDDLSSSSTATAGPVTVTLSEISYDSNAIYLALLIENQNGFADNAQSDTSMYLECETDMYRTDGTKKTFSKEYGNMLAYLAEGTFTDSHTFTGLVQLTDTNLLLSDYASCDITFQTFIQELTTGTMLTGTLDGESETISYMEYDRRIYDGPWTFHLDLSQLDHTSQDIPVNRTNDQGFGIEKLVKTKYELYAVPIFPDGISAQEDYVVTIWDADGNPLESHGSSLEIRSIYGRDISKVTVYILTWDDFVECKGNNSYLQPQKAVFGTTVDLTK